MADARDILLGGARGTPGPGEGAKPEKKKEEKMKRPEGMSREAFALLGGSHPIAPSQLMDGLKKKKDKQAKPKPSSKGTVIFRLKPFRNQARSDNLELVHWVKGYKDATGRVRDADEGDYAFVKYNKKNQIFRYDDEEWAHIIAPSDTSGWSRQETDYLLDLCELYDLRFMVIADRYDFPGGAPRSMEDLKERYYSVARKLLMAREANDALLTVNPLLRQPYNSAHERSRKAALLALQKRDPEKEEQENAILERAREIEEKRKADLAASHAAQAAAAAAARKLQQATPSGVPRPLHMPDIPFDAADLRYPLDFPNTTGPTVPSLFSVNVTTLKPPPGVYARGQHTRDTALAQASSLTGNSQRTQKLVEQALLEIAAPGPPRINTRNVCGNFLALRGEVIQLVEARQAAAKRQADAKKVKRQRADDATAAPRQEKRQRVAKRYD